MPMPQTGQYIPAACLSVSVAMSSMTCVWPDGLPGHLRDTRLLHTPVTNGLHTQSCKETDDKTNGEWRDVGIGRGGTLGQIPVFRQGGRHGQTTGVRKDDGGSHWASHWATFFTESFGPTMSSGHQGHRSGSGAVDTHVVCVLRHRVCANCSPTEKRKRASIWLGTKLLRQHPASPSVIGQFVR
jgi:hypothetical protein